MSIRIAINGFGRIGRMIVRALMERKEKDIHLVAINDLAPFDMNTYLLSYDSVHGRLKDTIRLTDNALSIQSLQAEPIQMLQCSNPKDLPWADLGVDVVLECTGRFQDKDAASSHLAAGAKRVIVSAPCKGADKTIIYGLNHDTITKDDVILSNGSCTTNCFAPLVSVLHESFGLEQGYMTTIHAYTGDQRLLDTCHSDPRRARAATLSMIPTSTGAARAVFEIFPELKGKIDGTAIRVPTPNVSVVDFTFQTQKIMSVDGIHHAMQEASLGRLKNILAYNTDPLVSVDFNQRSESSIFDATQTAVLGNAHMGRVVSWYDNEWGFSHRMIDVAQCLKNN